MEQSNEPTIIEINRTICEFVGWEFKKDPKFEYMAYFEGRQMWCDNLQGINKVLLEGFCYHKNWGKLMEAWNTLRKKVEQDFPDDYPPEFGEIIDRWKVWCFTVNIEWAHKEVYKAIQWYNKNKPNGTE